MEAIIKKLSNIIWGLALVAAGVIIALNALGIADINLLFDGWWTLFLIIPGVIGIITKRSKMWSVIITLVGVFLLLSAQEIIDSQTVGALIVPSVIIVIGARMIFRGLLDGRVERRKLKINSIKGEKIGYSAVFGGQNITLNGESFDGAELDAVFGGIKLDLREAVIESDCVIDLTAIFGGIDIFLPDNVKVDVSSTSLFGGISDKKAKIADESAPVVYINGVCMFGGADIK